MLRKCFTNQTTNGDSLEFEHPGGEAQMIVAGVLGGCAVTPYAKYAQVGEYVPFDQGGQICQWTEPLIKTMNVKHPCTIMLVITGASGTTNVSAWI